MLPNVGEVCVVRLAADVGDVPMKLLEASCEHREAVLRTGLNRHCGSFAQTGGNRPLCRKLRRVT